MLEICSNSVENWNHGLSSPKTDSNSDNVYVSEKNREEKVLIYLFFIYLFFYLKDINLLVVFHVKSWFFHCLEISVCIINWACISYLFRETDQVNLLYTYIYIYYIYIYLYIYIIYIHIYNIYIYNIYIYTTTTTTTTTTITTTTMPICLPDYGFYHYIVKEKPLLKSYNLICRPASVFIFSLYGRMTFRKNS